MMMLVNVWERCRASLTGLVMIACLLIMEAGHAQIVDPKALGGTTRCVTIADSLYEITVDVQSPALCPFTSYTITWDLLDRNSVGERVTGPGPIKHTYRLTDFLKNCGNGSDNGERLIKVETDCKRDNKSFSIYFKIKPVADPFIPDICVDRSISLQNRSCASTADTKFLWTFPDGTTSANTNPTKTFSTATVGTTIPISLSASNDCGSSVKTINVPVRGTPTAKVKASDYSFLAQDTTITCLPSGGTLTMDATTSLDGTSYQWTITPSTYRYVQNTNSSSPVAKIQFTRTGNYTITLVAINDCGRSQPVVCQHRAVDLPTVALARQADLCEAGKYTLSGITPGASYSLNGALILPGQSIDVPVSNTPYIVTGSAGNQCGVRTVADTFLVQSPQAVQISLPGQQTVVCAGTARFPISVNLTGGEWDGTGKDFIETTSSGSFFNPRTVGQYTVIYKRGSGVCSRSDAVQISVEGGRPTVQNVSSCGSEAFVKLRGDPTGGVGKWSLPGNPGAVRNDTLFLAGLTSAQLTVTYEVRYGVSGCLSTTTATVSIGRPKAAFTITGACSNSAPQVQNQSTGGNTFDWTLNGLSGITGSQPTFTLVPGLNRIELKVSAGSCSDATSQTLLVVAPPTPVSISTAFPSDCSPMRVTFTQPGTANPSVQYAWNLGQGQTSTAFSPPVQTYLNQSRLPQPVSVSLTASNGCGRQTATTTFTVRPLAKAEIGVDSTLVRCTPVRIKFANRSTGQAGSTWLFGDGSAALPSTADTLSHLFSARDSARTYLVQLIVTSQCGRDTDRVSIRVIPTIVRPLVTISSATPCPGDRVTFTDATTPKPVRVIWRLADGSTQVTPVANWTFTQPNTTYTISMTALTECGFDTTSRRIRTTTLPTGSFTVTPGIICAGQSLSTTNQTNPALRFRWDFGDGSPVDSVTFAPTHRYTNPGSYSLSLTLFGNSAGGCRSVLPGSVTVRSKPVALIQFGGDSLQCLPGKIELQAGTQAGITGWQWRLSDGRTFNGPAIEVPLQQPGTFDVSLTVSNGIPGCADSTRRAGNLQVIDCAVQVPGAFSPNRDGIGDGWTLFGQGILKIKALRVRSRWGEVIYEGLDIPASSLRTGECWDGTFNGTPMPAGSYTYEAEILLRGNRTERRVGSVELRR